LRDKSLDSLVPHRQKIGLYQPSSHLLGIS